MFNDVEELVDNRLVKMLKVKVGQHIDADVVDAEFWSRYFEHKIW